jgi:protocatechuate 3,4-dioxygenase beta subunit
MSDSNYSRRTFMNVTAVTVATTLLPTAAIADTINPTAKQVEGPFFPKHQQIDKDADMTQVEGLHGHAKGEVLSISGKVVDTDGIPVKGAVLNIWQADKNGRYMHEDAPETAPLDPHFQYWAILKSADDGSYNLKTIKPGKYAAMADWDRPPHIHFRVAKKGMRELTTQMYFANEPLNKIDKLYLETPENERSSIVVDFKSGHGQFDIVLSKV